MSIHVDKSRAGRCYEWAARVVANMGGECEFELPPDIADLRVVHGVCAMSDGSGRRMGHAWIEYRMRVNGIPGNARTSVVYDPVGRIHVPTKLYYIAGGIDGALCVRYTEEEILRHWSSYKHFGPYDAASLAPLAPKECG